MALIGPVGTRVTAGAELKLFGTLPLVVTGEATVSTGFGEFRGSGARGQGRRVRNGFV